MKSDWDALVVGAGPAGCAAAHDLAIIGKRVLILDRRSFPREKACAGALTMKSLNALRYSVRPIVRHVCREMTLGLRTGERVGTRKRSPLAVMTVRSEFDEFCLRKTLDAGAEFLKIRAVLGVEERDTCVVVRTDDGELRGSFLVGADGANSTIRRLLWGGQLADSNGFAIEGRIASKELGSVPMEFDFGVVDGGYGWLFPKADHVNVGVYTCRPDVALDRSVLLRYVRSRLGEASAAQVDHIVGSPIGLRQQAEWPVHARVTLVGDAAQAVDPLLGEGIFYAIWSGQEAASAIREDQAGGRPFALAMADRGRRISRDLRTNWQAAKRFYAEIDRGYRLLRALPIRHGLMAGFAAGWTFSQTKHRFLLAPIVSRWNACARRW